MRIPRIYTDSPLHTGSPCELDDNAANHVGRVLRMQPGHQLRLFNGDGKDYTATITEAGKKNVTVTIESAEANATESPLTIVLGQTLSKGDRMDYAVQKAVEMGVTTIAPLTTERSDVKLKGDREEKRLRHWQQVAISAAEQCGRAKVPNILPVMTVAEWLQYRQTCQRRPDDRPRRRPERRRNCPGRTKRLSARSPRPPGSAHRNGASGGHGTVPVVMGRYWQLSNLWRLRT